MGIDTRPAVKEEVNEPGAKFIEVSGSKIQNKAGGMRLIKTERYKQKQQKISEAAAKADIIITTAQIPERQRLYCLPKLLLNVMKPGSIIYRPGSRNRAATRQERGE